MRPGLHAAFTCGRMALTGDDMAGSAMANSFCHRRHGSTVFSAISWLDIAVGCSFYYLLDGIISAISC